AGVQGPTALRVDATPTGLNDVGRTKYTYYYRDNVWRPIPLPAALGYYMGLASILASAEQAPLRLQEALATDQARVRFLCPAQDADTVRDGFVVADESGPLWPTVRMSYLFNATALARRIEWWGETPAGRLTGIRHPTEV